MRTFKSLVIFMVLALVLSVAVFANGQDEQASYKDGVYFAQEDGFSGNGWKYMATLVVKDGKIVEAEWNGANVMGGPDKITQSESGAYGMVAKGGAQAEWHEQAAKAEAFLIEKQDPTAIKYSDDEGHTDAISGVSIHVVEFFELAEKALAAGPVGYGMYKDGNYTAEEAEFNHGYKYAVNITVISGYIVAAGWDGIAEEGEKGKRQLSIDGEYGMAESASSPWFEQAAASEEYLMETQDPSKIKLDDEGGTDAISGVSITVAPFFTLAQEALAGAKR